MVERGDVMRASTSFLLLSACFYLLVIFAVLFFSVEIALLFLIIQLICFFGGHIINYYE